MLAFGLEVSPVKKAKPETIATTLRLPRATWEEINHLAVDKHTTMTALVLQAIADFLKKEAR
jgi:predicted transcriptional regulator